MVTFKMKKILKKIADLCNQASEEVYEDEETEEILNICDKLQDLIDKYINIDQGD